MLFCVNGHPSLLIRSILLFYFFLSGFLISRVKGRTLLMVTTSTRLNFFVTINSIQNGRRNGKLEDSGAVFYELGPGENGDVG